MAALEQSLERAGGDGGGGDDEDLESMSKDVLYELIQERDVPGRSGMTQDELVDALRGQGRGAAA